MAKPIFDLIHRLIPAKYGQGWARYATLLQHWEAIVGPEFAAHTKALELRPLKEGLELQLGCPAALAYQLKYQEQQILDRANSVFGFGAISKIKWVQLAVTQPAPLAPQTHKPSLSALPPLNPDLPPETLAALEHFRAQVAKR